MKDKSIQENREADVCSTEALAPHTHTVRWRPGRMSHVRNLNSLLANDPLLLLLATLLLF